MRPLFIHVPKTGGQWVRLALRTLNVETVFTGRRDPHITLAELPVDPDVSGYSFTFVRHPVDWFTSLWTVRNAHVSRIQQFSWIKIQMDADFNKCVETYLTNNSGYVSSLLDQYTLNVNYIGQTSSLIDDFITVLNNCGITFDENLVRSLPRVNVSPPKPEWDQSLFDAFVVAEDSSIKRWNLVNTSGYG